MSKAISLGKELQVPQNLRRTAKVITLGTATIDDGVIGYLIGNCSSQPGGEIKTLFISLCGSYWFDVTKISGDHFQNV